MAGPPSAAPVPPPPRQGTLDERGVARHDAVHALAWTCRGLAKVVGVVDVGDARIDGNLTVGGKVTTDAFRLKGSLDAAASIEVQGRLEIEGTTKVVGWLRAGEGEVRGAARVGGEVKVERLLRTHGTFAAPEVKAGAFLADGSLDIEKELSAADVAVKFHGHSRIGTIRSPNVTLTLVSPNPVEMVLGRSLLVQVDRIEAGKVELTGVSVDFVRADEIVLGRDAHLRAYEGTIVRQHPSARVGPESRTPPPHGLRR
jgi:cytoskeletal protein CcmA (bactofilin family)